jgi:hypothetical protein
VIGPQVPPETSGDGAEAKPPAPRRSGLVRLAAWARQGWHGLARLAASARRPAASARRLAASARQGWLSVRPRTRRGGLFGVLKIGALAGVLSVAFFVAAGIASSTVAEYGFHPETNARAWTAHQLSYGGAAMCATCHSPEYGKATTASHAGIGCESCHGPLLDHAIAAADTPETLPAIAVPTNKLCLTCHAQATGRPAGVRQIVPSAHYVSACLDCHDPHTAIARRPPVVEHPLTNLPDCVTCHGPEGFKARNQRHPTVSTDNSVCLSCHLTGRGPAQPLAEAIP